MKKTDLRVLRTQKNIKEAFYALRQKYPLEKIRVRDICERAMINSSTFYAHYTDVFYLSDLLENALIEETFASFDLKDCLFTDTKHFLVQINETLEAHHSEFNTLFNGRMDVMYRKLEHQLKEYYCALYQGVYDDIFVSFVISGVMHSMECFGNDGTTDITHLVNRVTEIIQKIV